MTHAWQPIGTQRHCILRTIVASDSERSVQSLRTALTRLATRACSVV